MKKAIALLFVLALICSFAACSNANSGNPENGIKNDSQAAETIADQNEQAETAEITTAEETKAEKSNDSLKERLTAAAACFEKEYNSDDLAKFIKNEYDSSIMYSLDKSNVEEPKADMPFEITINGLKITSGYKVSDLMASGFALDDEDHKIDAGEALVGFYADKDGLKLRLGIINTSNVTQKAKDCEIFEIITDNYMEGVEYQGLTQGASIDEVAAKLGLPERGIEIKRDGPKDQIEIRMSFGYSLKGNVTMIFVYDPATDSAVLTRIDLTDNIRD